MVVKVRKKTEGEGLKLPLILQKRPELTKENSEEYVEEVLERQSPSPEHMKRLYSFEEKEKGTQSVVSLPTFFRNTLQSSLEVRHFTPPFVNVSAEGKSLPRYRYDPKRRAYESGLEEVKE